MEKILLTANDIQQLTGISKPTIYEWFHREDFPTIRIGRKVVVQRDAFHNWLNDQAAAPKRQGGE